MRHFISTLSKTLLLCLMLLPACGDSGPTQAPAPEPQVTTVAMKIKTAPPENKPDISASLKKASEASGSQSATPRKESVNETSLSLPETPSSNKWIYVSEGKIDPFAPLIKKEVKGVSKDGEALTPIISAGRMLTPLEKLDYSQMKLVAVMSAESGRVAMVQQADGKGYVVGVGTYIGRNGGIVTEIVKEGLVIQERYKNYKGDVVTQTRELKLNKAEDGGL